MKTAAQILVTVLISFQFCTAQKMDTKYSFSSGTGASLNSMVGADTLIGANIDDSKSAVISLPNLFYFYGQYYNSFQVTPNGCFAFGTNAIFPIQGPSIISQSQKAMLFPYLADGHTRLTGSVQKFYNFIDDKFTIQWNTAIPYNNSATNSTFQIELDFTNYAIKFIYGTCASDLGAVGIIEDNGFFSSVNSVTNTANSDTILNSPNTAPQTGVYYLWSPIFSTFNDGKVGIGTSDPQTNLDIKGQVRIRSGNPEIGKVLTTDNYGYAEWQALPAPPNELPINATSSNTLRYNGSNWEETSGIKIDNFNNTIISNGLKISNGAGANKILTSDASGNATWQAHPAPVAFNVRLDSNRTLFLSTDTKLHYGVFVAPQYGNFNIGNAYDAINDEFVVPSDGVYSFTSNVRINATTQAYAFSTNIKVTTSSNVLIADNIFASGVPISAGYSGLNYNNTVVLSLLAGQKVSVYAKRVSGTSNTAVEFGFGGTQVTGFSGFKIQ